MEWNDNNNEFLNETISKILKISEILDFSDFFDVSQFLKKYSESLKL